MTTEKVLSEKLLKENGIDAASVTDEQIQKIEAKVAKQTAQVRRAKWATAISWALTIAAFVGMPVYRMSHAHLGQDLGYLMYHSPIAAAVVWMWCPLLLISIFLTISRYLRSRSLGHNQLMARLARLEKHLEHMARNE